MTLIYANRVHEACSASGVQNLTLLGALSGKTTFSSKLATGSKVPYVLLDGNGIDWEVGYGTLSSASELQRTTIVDSSASTGRINSDEAGTPIKLSLSTNQHEVFCGTNANNIFAKDENGDLTDPSPIRAAIFVDTLADMTALLGLADNETVIVKGGAALGDGDGGIYYWDAADAGAESPPSSYEHDTIATGLFKRIKIAVDSKSILLTALDTSTTLGGGSASDSKVPSQLAVKTALDALLGANDAEVYKGVIDCSGNPNYPAADAGHTYRVSVAGKIGGASGANVEVGDRLQCLADSTAAGTQAAVGASWWIVQANIDGAVVGPASAVNLRLAVFSGTSGKVIADGGAALSVDGTFASNSDALIPTEKAIKTYVASAVAGLTLTALHVNMGDWASAVPADIGGGQTPINYIVITGDDTDATAGGAAGYLMGLNVHYRFGGSNMKGNRAAIYGFADLEATSPANTGYRNYVGVNGVFYTNQPSAGTNTSTGALDAGFSFGGQVFLDHGATNYLEVSNEFDTFTAGAVGGSACSMRYLRALSLVGCNAVRGSELDAALTISGATTTGNFGPHIGWNFGICFTDVNTLDPFYSGTTLIGDYYQGSITGVTHGIDWHGRTFSGKSLWMPNFSVTGAGLVTGAQFVPTSATVPTDGFYLASTNTLGFATNSTGRLTLGTASLSPVTTDTIALGTNSLRYTAVKLSQTGNVNFNNGNLTISGATDVLTFGGSAPPTVVFNTFVTMNAAITFNNQSAFKFVTDTREWDWQALNASLGDKFRMIVGSVGDVLYVTNTGSWQFLTNITPQTNDGAALGTSSLAWSDAFFASGAVLNFNAGDVTITHASNVLTVDGGDFKMATGFFFDHTDTQSTVGAAGGASALPATPTGYTKIKVAGTTRVVPYYAVS